MKPLVGGRILDFSPFWSPVKCCLYLATAPKSNSAFAYFDALRFVEKEQSGDVPDPLKDASRDKQGLGHGQGYKYPHAYRDHYVPEQYLPSDMQGTYFYQPGELGYERTVAQRLAYWRERDEEEHLGKRVRRYVEGDAGLEHKAGKDSTGKEQSSP